MATLAYWIAWAANNRPYPAQTQVSKAPSNGFGYPLSGVTLKVGGAFAASGSMWGSPLAEYGGITHDSAIQRAIQHALPNAAEWSALVAQGASAVVFVNGVSMSVGGFGYYSAVNRNGFASSSYSSYPGGTITSIAYFSTLLGYAQIGLGNSFTLYEFIKTTRVANTPEIVLEALGASTARYNARAVVAEPVDIIVEACTAAAQRVRSSIVAAPVDLTLESCTAQTVLGLTRSFDCAHSLSLVEAEIACIHALRGPVEADYICSHALTAEVWREFVARHELLAATPVLREFACLHSMFDPAVDLAPPVSATLDGQAIELVSFSVTCNEDSYCLGCEAELADVEAWVRCLPGAALLIEVGAQVFHFLIDGRSRTRAYPADQYTLTARSRTSRLDAPHAAPITRTWTNTSARTIAQDVCNALGVALDWRMTDWPLATYAAERQTPLAILGAIKTEAGVLLSTPEGGLLVQYRYPVSPPAYAAAVAGLLISDYADIVQLDDTLEDKPGYNVVNVLSEQSSAGQETTLQEWTGPPGGQTPDTLPPNQRCVAAFTHPYQSVNLVTSCPARVIAQGRVNFDHEETVEFVLGKAGVAFVPEQILSTRWLCAELGAVSVAGKTLTAAVGGQSLLKIAYRASYQRFIIEHDGKQRIQVWAQVETQQAPVASPDMVRVVRWPGDREAPEVIVDALCTSVAIKTERGRNYLDAEGFLKERYVATTPPRAIALPGAVAEVQDVSLGGVWRGKITGWKLSWSTSTNGPDASMVWDIERSVSI